MAGLVSLGIGVGAIGTLVGAGGGFILIPVLALLNPRESPQVLTAISLSVVLVNAISGSLSYARQGRIDYRSGWVFALAGLPGAVLGAWLTRFLDRRVFDPLVGVALILGAAFILWRPGGTSRSAASTGTRRLVERDGTVYVFTPRVGLGALASVGISCVSSLIGIGGGIIHVPVMVLALGFPTHVATATSHFVLAILVLAGVIVHAADGSLAPGIMRAIPLAVGAAIGAPFGAWLSTRIGGRWILRGLAIGLASVGLRLLLSQVWKA